MQTAKWFCNLKFILMFGATGKAVQLAKKALQQLVVWA